MISGRRSVDGSWLVQVLDSTSRRLVRIDSTIVEIFSTKLNDQAGGFSFSTDGDYVWIAFRDPARGVLKLTKNGVIDSSFSVELGAYVSIERQSGFARTSSGFLDSAFTNTAPRTSDVYQAYCQRGPLAPPAQKDCEDRPDGSCWENSQSCYDELAVRAVDLSLSGVPLLAGTNVSILGSSTALRSCGGLVLAIRYEARAEAAIRTATDHLIV